MCQQGKKCFTHKSTKGESDVECMHSFGRLHLFRGSFCYLCWAFVSSRGTSCVYLVASCHYPVLAFHWLLVIWVSSLFFFFFFFFSGSSVVCWCCQCTHQGGRFWTHGRHVPMCFGLWWVIVNVSSTLGWVVELTEAWVWVVQHVFWLVVRMCGAWRRWSTAKMKVKRVCADGLGASVQGRMPGLWLRD